ncbi:YnbE family lipoprotein [Zooshikella marina]|uniref:YnbE family lipoprotein n=1 Tax=Zooshikella ganghwensis TaxID=202772 RepID=A0A4P9VMC1_9GAMM|nr:YnbE family lipoprotein [Zooshikella ganghwensis]MBU2707009.1 YnbE family lipoprotein [Zooshikella ganghwensis]RDH43517.1 YnbE family lipoprotein [Zooshikella ganghwensis]
MNKERMLSVTVISLLASCITACTPRVEVAVPEKPITINLNVKVEHEIKVKIDKELDEIFSEDSELF